MATKFKDADFNRSTFCGVTCKACVTVAHQNGTIAVRDSKDPSKKTLSFTQDEWQAFVAGVKNGEFDF